MNSNTKAKNSLSCHSIHLEYSQHCYKASCTIVLSVCVSVCAYALRGCCTYNVYWSLTTNVPKMYFVYHSLVLLTGLMVQLVVYKCLESVLPTWDYGETTYSHMKASQRIMRHSTFSRTIFTLTATRKKVGHEVLTCHIQ